MSLDDISAERIAADIDRIASWREDGPGFHRPTFSPSWAAARAYVAAEAEKAGCVLRADPAGNLRARPRRLSWDAPAWVCGSHLDSVPGGGKYDGVAGVVAALELLRVRPALPLELIVFAEEEGPEFGVAMLGSRAWAGSIEAERLLALRSRAGVGYGAAGAPFGVDPDRLRAGDFGFPFERYRGMVEIHAEQGAGLWKAGKPVAVVSAAAGRRWYECRLSGVANHAGSTAMADRADALAGASDFVLGVESLGRELHGRFGGTTATVGRLSVSPNATNVIPGEASLGVDFRSRSDRALAEGDSSIRALLAEIGARRGLGAEIGCVEELPAQPFDAALCGRLKRAAAGLGIDLPESSSGALHDAVNIAPRLPTAMLFVASRGGISHNPDEYSRPEDIALAARIVAAAFE